VRNDRFVTSNLIAQLADLFQVVIDPPSGLCNGQRSAGAGADVGQHVRLVAVLQALVIARGDTRFSMEDLDCAKVARATTTSPTKRDGTEYQAP
jgi:hypothetical protein